MKRTVALAAWLTCLALLPAPPALADGDGEDSQQVPEREAVERLQKELLEANQETVSVGSLEVTFSVVPNHFLYLAATDFLDRNLESRDAEYVRERFERLAERKDETVGRPGIVLEFVHEDARDDDFYCFEGDLDDHLRVRARRDCRLRGVSHSGPLERRRMTLFKASRAGIFSGRSNVPPVIKRTYMAFEDEPFRVALVTRRPFSEKAEELELQVGAIIHFSGSAIRGNQADFERGASAVYVSGRPVELPLPLEAPEVPEALAALLPEEEEDDD